MMKKLILFLSLLSLIYLNNCAYFNDYTISGVSINHAHINGQDTVTITGCGFRGFTEVVCVWDEKYYSPSSKIISDTSIVCQTPIIPKSSLLALPITTQFKVFFDGDFYLDYYLSNDFTFGPSISSFSPRNGFTTGGESFVVNGAYFSDYKSATVTFNGRICNNTQIITDTQISCKVPPGEFNEFAVVNVIFDNNDIFYLHFEETYHYGPLITGLSPPCGYPLGGTRVSVFGIGFDDPILDNAQEPYGPPIVEVVYGNTRYFGLNVTISSTNNSIIFTTPSIGSNIFGVQPLIYVFFREVESKVSVTNQFTYGPLVYSSSSSAGHSGGGDSITITGCGFHDYSPSIISLTVGSTSICAGGLQIIQGSNNIDSIVCQQTAAVDCTSTSSLTQSLSVGFDFGGSTYTFPSFPYTIGPQINPLTFGPVRGPRNGGTTVSVSGSYFFYTSTSSSWSVTVSFDTGASGVSIPSVVGTILSDTLLSYTTPLGLFDLDVSVSFSFSSSCSDLPRDSELYFHYGPVCTLVSPTNGYLSGLQTVTVSGQGFTEDGNIASSTAVQFCIERLNPYYNCSTFEPSPINSYFTVSNTQITVQTPSIRQNVSTVVGGNRLFGDVADVFIHFYQPGQPGVEIPINQLRPGLNVAQIECQLSYTFGPALNSISPTRGPFGPRANNSPGTPVTISGSAFSDPLYNSDIVLNIGSLSTFNDKINSDTQITANTLWGGSSSNIDIPSALFGNCNSTNVDLTVNWGPRINDIQVLKGEDVYTYEDGVWGVNSGDLIYIQGYGFSEYYNNLYFYFYPATAFVGGVETPVYYQNDNTLYVYAPDLPFGTNATIEVIFGYDCDGFELNNYFYFYYYYYYSQTTLPNYNNIIIAPKNLYYQPEILSFSPTFGKTSGGDEVLVSGEGFSGYTSYYCSFGGYTNDEVYYVTSDTEITCYTPYNRAEFNTDVQVSVNFLTYYNNDTSFPNQRVIAKDTFHYGPICNSISPQICTTTGCSGVSIIGSGFQDCTPSTVYPFKSCIFQNYQVQLYNPSTKKLVNATQTSSSTFAFGNTNNVLLFNSPPSSCMSNPVIQILFPDAIVSNTNQLTVTCSYPNSSPVSIHYGPVFTSQTSTYYKNGISYGWTGDSVTINGNNFKDPGLFTNTNSVTCNFGNFVGTTTYVDPSKIVCTAPSNTWNTLVQITVTWNGPSGSCFGSTSLVAGQFHYGPVILSSSPIRGYVQSTNPITITGFAFQCCGITSLKCLFPNQNSTQTTPTGNSLICPVPSNSNIGTQINNIGVGFTSASFSNSLTLTETGTSLTYFYGPFVNSITPNRSILSGRGQSITIIGEGFKDPFFSLVFCDFVSLTEGSNFTATEPVNGSLWTDTTVVCNPQLFSHSCGSIDQLRPRWRRAVSNPQNNYYYPTVPPVVPITNSAPFYSNGTSNTPAYVGPLYYGPSVIGVFDSNFDQITYLNRPINGYSIVVVVYDNLADFVSSPSGNFGNEAALCQFAGLDFNIYDIYLTPIIAVPNDYNSFGYVLCVIPSAPFGYSGQTQVFLSPNFVINYEVSYTWIPFATTLSRRYGLIQGFDTVVVYGEGFCAYDKVVCLFGNTQAVQSNIFSDKLVSCVSPPKFSGSNSVQLILSSGNNCNNLDQQETITVQEKFTFAGVTGFSPQSGPTCGFTTITISGFGFSVFDSITCFWGKQTFAANFINDNTITCPSIDVSSRTPLERDFCYPLTIIGYYENQKFVLDVPFRFLYGTPQVASLIPSSVDIDQPDTVVTVNGEFFNGIGPNQNQFQCRLGDFNPVPGTLVQKNGNYYITCSNLFNKTTTKIGTYNLEILFPCSSNQQFTTNRVPLRITQNPQILSINPVSGPEIGGVEITIRGSQFNGGTNYLCSFGDVSNNQNTLISAKYIDSTRVVCLSPYTPVDENVPVQLALSLDGKSFVGSPDDYIIVFIGEYDSCS